MKYSAPLGMLPIQREITQIKHAVCYLIAELFLNNLFWRQHCQSSFAMTISGLNSINYKWLVCEINTRSYCIVSLAMRCSLLYCLSTFLSFYMHKFPKAGNLNEWMNEYKNFLNLTKQGLKCESNHGNNSISAKLKITIWQ